MVPREEQRKKKAENGEERGTGKKVKRGRKVGKEGQEAKGRTKRNDSTKTSFTKRAQTRVETYQILIPAIPVHRRRNTSSSLYPETRGVTQIPIHRGHFQIERKLANRSARKIKFHPPPRRRSDIPFPSAAIVASSFDSRRPPAAGSRPRPLFNLPWLPIRALKIKRKEKEEPGRRRGKKTKVKGESRTGGRDFSNDPTVIQKTRYKTDGAGLSLARIHGPANFRVKARLNRRRPVEKSTLRRNRSLAVRRRGGGQSSRGTLSSVAGPGAADREEGLKISLNDCDSFWNYFERPDGWKFRD